MKYLSSRYEKKLPPAPTTYDLQYIATDLIFIYSFEYIRIAFNLTL